MDGMDGRTDGWTDEWIDGETDRQTGFVYRQIQYYLLNLSLYRRVVEYGTYVKHLKVEVYLFDLKLCVHPHINDPKQYCFSRADTISELICV